MTSFCLSAQDAGAQFTVRVSWPRRLNELEALAQILALAASKRYSSRMFAKRNATGYVPALSGIDRKTLVHGDKTLMTEFVLRKGAVLPRHSHPHEQTGFLVRGQIRLSVGSEEYNAEVGDSWCIPGGVEHGVMALEDTVAIEVFAPARQDYLPEPVKIP